MKMNKKRWLALGLAGLLALSMAGCGQDAPEGGADPQNGVTISNEIGGETFDVTYEPTPERIVSVGGFTTEMLLALGLEDRIVGCAYQDNEVLPQYADAYGKLNYLSDQNPSKEVLLNVEPDFLTGWASAFGDTNFPKSFCDDNDIKIYIPRVEYPNATMDEVYEDFKNLGEIFKVQEKADEIITAMKSSVQAVEDKIKGQEPVSVFLYDSGEDQPYTASAGLPTDMITRAGGTNIFAGTEKNWMGVSWEEVVAANPQYILVMQYDMSDDVEGKIKFLKNNPALKDVDAIANDRIMVLGLSDVVGGERNTAAIEKMAEFFHPDSFQ